MIPHKKDEFENFPWIELTYLTPDWDPHSITFQEQEEALMNNKGKLHEWSNKRKDVDRYISRFDTAVASTCPWIELTYLTPEWDPQSITLQEQEEALMNNKGKLHEWSNKR